MLIDACLCIGVQSGGGGGGGGGGNFSPFLMHTWPARDALPDYVQKIAAFVFPETKCDVDGDARGDILNISTFVQIVTDGSGKRKFCSCSRLRLGNAPLVCIALVSNYGTMSLNQKNIFIFFIFFIEIN